MYNFRQKILRRATLEPIQMNMYDDLTDSSAGFWNTFIKIQNPVTNLTSKTAINIEDTGMNWNEFKDLQRNPGHIRRTEGDVADPDLSYAASTGILPGQSNAQAGSSTIGSGNNQIIKRITVYHLIDWGRKYVAYEYVNPRIEEITLDDLTWESSDPNVIDITFSYDSFHIHMPTGVSEEFIRKHATTLYPISPNLDETPIPFVNTGIDAFNTGINSAVEAATEQASNIPGFGKFFD